MQIIQPDRVVAVVLNMHFPTPQVHAFSPECGQSLRQPGWNSCISRGFIICGVRYRNKSMWAIADNINSKITKRMSFFIRLFFLPSQGFLEFLYFSVTQSERFFAAPESLLLRRIMGELKTYTARRTWPRFHCAGRQPGSFPHGCPARCSRG